MAAKGPPCTGWSSWMDAWGVGAGCMGSGGGVHGEWGLGARGVGAGCMGSEGGVHGWL